MRILLFGATGMVGYGVLRECLLADDVEAVTVVGRTSLGRRHHKLTELVVPDVADLESVAAGLTGFDACLFCLGVSSVGMGEADYRRITFDLTLSVARRLAVSDPGMTFAYVSGAGTDAHGRQMWARVKGETENAIRELPLRAVMFRPGIIEPRFGARSKTRVYDAIYLVLSPVLGLVRRLAPAAVTSTDAVGRAMLQVARKVAAPDPVDNRAIGVLAGRG